MTQHYNNPGLPSTLYSGGGQRVDTRQIGAMLYNEQKQREAMRLKEANALNEEMKSNVAKIRDADVPDFVANYQDYANSRKKLLYDNSFKKDPQLYAAAQMEVQKKYANAMKLANESRQMRDLYEDVDKDRFKNGDHYVENYYDIRSIQNKTPLSKLRQVQTGVDPTTGQPVYSDYSSPDVLIDQTPHYDFNKAIEDVKGKSVYTGYSTRKNLDKEGLNYEETKAKYGNSPSLVFSGLLDKIASSKEAYRSAMQGGKAITPEMFDDMVKQYKSVDPEKWKQIGKTPEEIKLFHPDNQTERFAAFKTMQDFINSKVELETKKEKNDLVERNLRLQDKYAELKKAHEYRMNEISARATHTATQVKSILNGEIEDLINSSKSNPIPMKAVTKSGAVGTISSYNIPLTESVVNAVKLDKNDYVDAVRYVKKNGEDYIYSIKYVPELDKEGKTIVGYKKDKEGKPVVDLKESRFIPIKQFRNQYGKNLFSGKILQNELGQDMSSEDYDFSDDNTPTAPSKPAKPVKITKGGADNL